MKFTMEIHQDEDSAKIQDVAMLFLNTLTEMREKISAFLDEALNPHLEDFRIETALQVLADLEDTLDEVLHA